MTITTGSTAGAVASLLTAQACEWGSDSPEALDHCACPCGGTRHGWGRDVASIRPGDPHYVPPAARPELVGRYAYRGTPGRACGGCGRPMPTSDPRRRTCSPACRQAAYRRRVAALQASGQSPEVLAPGEALALALRVVVALRLAVGDVVASERPPSWMP